MATKEVEKDQGSVNLTAEANERIDAIKKLIFGENMVEYDHKFHDVFEKIEAYHKQSEEHLYKIHQELVDDLKEQSRKFDERVKKLEKEINSHLDKIEDDKTDRREFGKMLQAIAENLMK